MAANSHPHAQAQAVSAVVLGRHRIGPGEPVFIVAEAGVNHDGHLDTALRLVDAAAVAGADAVKFQAFRAADLTVASAPMARYQKRDGKAEPQRAMLARLELSADAFAVIKQRCAQRGVLFLATPFSPPDLACLTQLGVPAIKIASTDLTNAPLLHEASQSGLPLILSTGASTASEMATAVGELRRTGAGDRLVLLHCVSCYPTPLERINLRAIAALSQSFALPVGLSDHTTSTPTGAWAVAAGACVLEKHFTLDRSAPGPDHAMSLGPAELAEYVRESRSAERAMGSGALGMTPLESEVRAVAARSVVAASDIKAGTKLTTRMLTLKRPGTGIAPCDLPGLVGRCTAVPVPCDTLLTWDMVR